jgi:hypothetical protein
VAPFVAVTSALRTWVPLTAVATVLVACAVALVTISASTVGVTDLIVKVRTVATMNARADAVAIASEEPVAVPEPKKAARIPLLVNFDTATDARPLIAARTPDWPLFVTPTVALASSAPTAPACVDLAAWQTAPKAP